MIKHQSIINRPSIFIGRSSIKKYLAQQRGSQTLDDDESDDDDNFRGSELLVLYIS